MQVAARLVIGVADDLSWRVEQEAAEDSLLLRRTIALTAAAGLLLVALWIVPVWFGHVEPGGRTQALECASASTPAETTDELRFQVVKCAGAFFTPRQHAASAPRAPNR